AAVAGRDGPGGGPRGTPQRRGRAADVGRNPGLPGPLRVRLRDRMRLGAAVRREGGAGLRPAALSLGLPGAAISAGPARRHARAGPGLGAAADARLSAAWRAGVR